MTEKPKKKRRFLKALGRVGEILIQEVLIKIGSNLIKKIGGKKTLPSILFLLASLSLFAQFPNTGNKQRLGFQTTGDGLTWRGSESDTASIQPINNTSAWVILDTINLKFYTFDFTSNTWNALPQGTNIDTTSLSNRINLKLNISDTAAMLLPYATKEYADTTGRLYAREDFLNVSTSTLTWTQTDTLIPGGVTVVQVYRNGQILLPSQYTIPTSTSVVIAATSFKVNDNYTVIFPRGGGAGSGGGSGSLTSISGGTGITVSPDPITTTGTVSADLSVLMELSDTASLSNRINTKLNISDTLSMLAPYFLDADTSLLNLTSRFALKLNAADTASLSSRIDAKGTGTVTSVATGYGITGGTITTTGELVLDSAVVFSRIRDSIVDVAIGNDTIKILKQEYAPATTSVLTWTITPKFPIQLKQYILVFRNGQLLINDQYNLTDTNQITIVSNSFKIGSNYTVVTVSGIGSVGTGTFPNPVYPEAGIALSTGSAWASSIPNNSANWNVAFNDKINNAAFTGTTTKTLTLTQYDGGTFTPTFTDLQGIVAADTASMLTPYLRKADTSLLNLTSRFATKLNISDTASMLTNYLQSGVAALTYQTILTNPVTGTGTTNTLPLFTGASTLGNSIVQQSSNNIGINTTPFASLTLAQGKNIMLDASSNNVPRILFYETNARDENDVQFGAKIQYNSPSDRLEFVMRDSFAADPSGDELAISILRQTGNTTIYKDLAVTGAITEGGNNVLTNLDTASLSSRIDLKLNKTDTASLSTRIDGKVSLTATESISGTKTFNNLVNITNQMSISGSVSGGNQLLGKNSSNNGVADITLGTGLSITSNVLNASGTDTTSLSDRINLKYDKTGGTISGAVTLSTTTATPTSLLGKDGSNVVGTVTTVAQTGLMTRGEITETTGSPSAIFTVTHGLGSTPTSVLVTSAGIGGGDKIIFEVYTKNSTTFSVQAWNYDGTEASGKEVKIYWLALK
jgi:hypothetical protein